MFGWCRDAGLGDLGCLEQSTASRDCARLSFGLLRSLCLPLRLSLGKGTGTSVSQYSRLWPNTFHQVCLLCFWKHTLLCL